MVMRDVMMVQALRVIMKGVEVHLEEVKKLHG
jgi:hypothetical protein